MFKLHKFFRKPRNSGPPQSFAFVHIPKTGGETLEALLGIPKDHRLARDRDDLAGYSACIVRNPYSRLYSYYSHLRKHLYYDVSATNQLNARTQCHNLLARGEKMGPEEHRLLAERYPFRDWVLRLLERKEHYSNPVWGPLTTMSDYVNDERGQRLVTDVFYFERYVEEVSLLLDKLGKRSLIEEIEVTNASRKANLQEIYDDELRGLVFSHFEADFTCFGYSPDGPIC